MPKNTLDMELLSVVLLPPPRISAEMSPPGLDERESATKMTWHLLLHCDNDPAHTAAILRQWLEKNTAPEV
jgi:hypothetical protein